MKKGMFFWMLALMICAAGCADSFTEEPKLPTQEASHEVTQAEARQSLEKIVSDLKIPSTRGGEQKRMPPITSVYSTGRAAEATRSGEEIEPYFHIFNFGRDEGFAIMSGDDRVEPLLALTFKGEFTPETEIDTPGFEIAYSRMEEYYVQQVSTCSHGDDDGSGNIPALPGLPEDELIAYTIHGDPMILNHEMPLGYCSVKWGQTFPYNIYCGVPELGLYAYTGCVATAVAQLMSIYRYPSSYNDYSFDWNLMNQYICYNEYTEDQHPYMTDSTKFEPIARLMQQLGLSHNLYMEYEFVAPGNGSGANPENIPRTLLNFGYANGGTLVDYNTSSVVNELRSGYPVLIGGYDSRNGILGIYTYSGGHQWLGHGLMEYSRTSYYYNARGELLSTLDISIQYILCNWGWNGSCDGYYSSNVFDSNNGPDYPDEVSTRTDEDGYFQYELTAIVGIRK